MGAHTCNPSYLGGRDLDDHTLKLPWIKDRETTYQQTSLVWQNMSVAPVRYGAEVG
jgi:hypothetical protein